MSPDTIPFEHVWDAIDNNPNRRDVVLQNISDLRVAVVNKKHALTKTQKAFPEKETPSYGTVTVKRWLHIILTDIQICRTYEKNSFTKFQ